MQLHGSLSPALFAVFAHLLSLSLRSSSLFHVVSLHSTAQSDDPSCTTRLPRSCNVGHLLSLLCLLRAGPRCTVMTIGCGRREESSRAAAAAARFRSLVSFLSPALSSCLFPFHACIIAAADAKTKKSLILLHYVCLLFSFVDQKH